MATAFTELGLAPELLAVTGELGYETPTELDPFPGLPPSGRRPSSLLRCRRRSPVAGYHPRDPESVQGERRTVTVPTVEAA
jgi:hypothetical protein